MTTHFKTSLSAAMVAVTLMCGPLAAAQEAESANALRSFEPAYFDQYAPQNAFDMVRRIPGFQLRGGNQARGLGQGGANVLLNGQPITGKGGDPFDQIGRVPAINVVRLDILEGTSLDIPGLSGQVVNVVTQASEGVSGSWEWNPQWRKRQEPNLFNGNVKVSGETGNLSYAGEVRSRSFRRGDYGPETRRNADGSIYEIREYAGRYNGNSPGASVNLTWKPADDKIGNLNLEANLFEFTRKSSYQRDPITARGVPGSERFNFSEDEWNAQIDGDYQFPFLDGKLKLVGYYSAEHSPTSARFFDYDENEFLTAQTEFNQTADEGEAIAKTEYSWSPKDGRDWQVSLEGAYNFLDIENQFFDILDANNDSELNLLNIDEYRAEAFLTHTRKLGEKWSVQAAIGGEYSELTAGGETRTFVRPKGSISATYTKDESFNVTAKVERQVGQLNFFDFASSVSLQDEFDRGTNLNLVPDQSWWGEISLNKTFKDGHAVELLAHGRLVSDIVDNVLITNPDTGNLTIGRGNIGSGEQGGVHFNTTVKGDPFGFKGAEIKAGLAWHASSVTDPITGQPRQFSGQQLFQGEISFRHDIPNSDWAWGFFMMTFENASNYSPFEVSKYDEHPGWNEIFIEHKDVLGMKVNVELGSVLDIYAQLDRIIYDDIRGLAGTNIDRIENRRRNYEGPYLTVSVSDTF